MKILIPLILALVATSAEARKCNTDLLKLLCADQDHLQRAVDQQKEDAKKLFEQDKKNLGRVIDQETKNHETVINHEKEMRQREIAALKGNPDYIVRDDPNREPAVIEIAPGVTAVDLGGPEPFVAKKPSASAQDGSSTAPSASTAPTSSAPSLSSGAGGGASFSSAGSAGGSGGSAGSSSGGSYGAPEHGARKHWPNIVK